MTDLAQEVVAGDRRALAKGITLVESTRADHRDEAVALLDAALPATGGAMRVGVSGAPGVGKSTLIDALGNQLIDAGHRVAVLAVDPSSVRSGGSILGDKTRMDVLARREEAFIRPSPSGLTLGGVARRTREALLLCEAAGFDVVLVETVGVGQSETEVDGMVDTFVLLVQPGAGDELQGMKRGIVELADIVAITKADGELAAAARTAEADYRHALQFIRHRYAGWEPQVVACSGRTGEGVAELWSTVADHAARMDASGQRDRRRAEQAVAAFWSEVRAELVAALRTTAHLADAGQALQRSVAGGTRSASSAASELLRLWRTA